VRRNGYARGGARGRATDLATGTGAAGAEARHAVALEQQPHDSQVEHSRFAAARRCGDCDRLGGRHDGVEAAALHGVERLVRQQRAVGHRQQAVQRQARVRGGARRGRHGGERPGGLQVSLSVANVAT
jgi:hypothetical protein